MRSAWFIARTDIAHTIRQRETIAWVFVMPIVFFYFIGTMTGGFGGPRDASAPADPLVLQAPADAGFLVDEIAARLATENYAVTRVASDADRPAATRRLVVAAVEGSTFTGAVLAGHQQAVVFRNRAEGPTAQFDQVRVSRAVYSVLADLAVVTAEGSPASPAAFAAIAAVPRSLTMSVSSAGKRRDPPSGFAQAVPGTMVMFTMLVLLTSGAIALVIERNQGLLRRLASTPISREALTAGKWTGKLVLGLVQIAFGVAAGTLLFRMDWGGSLPMVGVLLACWAAFNASLAMLLGSIARSEGQMAGIGVLATMALAAFGGCWWPIEITPGWMQSLARLLPTGWAMDGLHRLVSFGDPWHAAAPDAAALALGALVLGWLAARLFRYQ